MSTSPILKIDDDSLLTIFYITTSQIPDHIPGTNRPLTIIRAASQVCRCWRQLLIQSPCIWGRVVDLGVERYGAQRNEWMDEVVRRAGSAPLWVSGKVNVYASADPLRFDSQAFFLQLFESWDRIERVSIIIRGDRITDAIMSRFLLRAPILKTVHIDFSRHRHPLLHNTLQPESPGRLFSDHAPYLEDIRVENVAIRVDSRWLSRIRKISLSGTTTEQLSVDDILVLLQRAPFLESFTIFAPFVATVGNSIHAHNPNAIPPTLFDIHIHTGLELASKILGYLKPGGLSYFHLTVLDHRQNLVNRDILPSIAKSLPSFISSYFASNVSTEVFFRLSPNQFHLTDFTIPGLPSLRYRHNLNGRSADFFLCILHELESHLEQDAVMTSLMGAFVEASALSRKPCHYRSVNETTISLKQIRINTFSNLYLMLALFENIQSMTTDNTSCLILVQLFRFVEARSADDPHHVLFPKLHTVWLTHWPGPGSNSDNCNGLIEFLTHREKIGFPVAKLDITSFPNRSKEINDLTALEDVCGLEVIWRQPARGLELEAQEICSYICGSGDPQRLKIVF